MSEWTTFPCPGSSPGWRYLPDGHIEVDGGGVPTRRWASAVNAWYPLILAAASSNGIPPHWIAAIMAIESGGKAGLCARLSNGACSQKEGAGLMQILPSTATALAGRSVTSEDLLQDHALSIDLGAKYIRSNVDKNGGDYVMGAISYNAGKVKCGTGNVWRPEGSTSGKTPCPPTSWGVVMGCTETPAGSGKIVVNDYPMRAIEYLNAAIDNFGASGSYVPPGPLRQYQSSSGIPVLALFAVAGFLVARRVPRISL